jgi:glutamate-1-semialdehyde aminotransferase
MNAIRAARAYTGRDKIVKCEGAYHGSVDESEISQTPALHLAGTKKRPKPVPDSNCCLTASRILGCACPNIRDV